MFNFMLDIYTVSKEPNVTLDWVIINLWWNFSPENSLSYYNRTFLYTLGKDGGKTVVPKQPQGNLEVLMLNTAMSFLPLIIPNLLI